MNQGFFLMVFFTLSWITFYHLAQFNNSVLWFRLSATSVFVFFIAYYFFTIRWFLKKESWYKFLGFFVSVYGVIFGFLATGTDLIISDVEFIGKSVTRPLFHPFGWWAFYGFVIAITLIINWALIKEYSNYSSEHRTKILYFLTGLLIFAGFNIVFNVIFPVFFNIYNFYEFGNYSVIFLLGFTAYAVVKHNLFDIKILISQFLVFIIWTFVAVRIALSNSIQEMLINIALLLLIFIIGVLLLRSISKETELTRKLLEATKKSLDLEKKLRERITKKTDEMIKKMEDIVR